MAHRRHQIAVATLLLFVMVASVQPQYTLGTLAPLILEDLGVSHLGYGSLVTIMFLLAGVASPIAGGITDRLGGRTVLMLYFATAALSLALIASAVSMTMLMIASAAGGLALAWPNPVTNTLLVTHITDRRRGVVLGIKQSGVTLGIVLAGATMPGLAAWLGWRGAATVVAVVTLMLGLGITFTVLRPRRVAGGPPSGSEHLAQRPGRWLPLYAFFMGAGISSSTSYLILYVHEDLHLSLQWAGVLLAGFGCMGVLSRLLLGWVAHRFVDLRKVLFVLSGAAVVAAALIMLAGPSTVELVWVGTFLMGASGSAWNVIAMYIVLRTGGERQSGAVTGIVQRGFYTGFCLSPLAFGSIVEWTSNYDPAWLIVLGSFTAAGFTAAAAGRERTRGVNRCAVAKRDH